VLANLEDQLERARQQVLQQTTLQDLLEQRNSLAQSQIMYFI
jgi:DNA-binding IscR family transcriptional regulator